MSQAAEYRPVYAWFVVGILMLAYVSSFVDRQILALLVQPIKRDLQISDTQISLLMGLSFATFYSVLGFPIGRLADRASRRGIIGWGIAVWSLMTAACGLARNFGQLFLARVGVGVGEAALSPPAYSLIADYFPRDRLGTAIGVYSLGIYLGSGVALMLGGWIIGLVGDAGMVTLPLIGQIRPWQATFLAIGIPGLLLALMIRLIREPVRGAMSAAGPVAPVSVGTVWRYVGTHRRAFASHNLGFAMISMVNYGWAFWVPTFLTRSHGWTPQQAGYVYGLWTATFGVAGVVAGGYLGDVLVRRGRADAKLLVGMIGATFQIGATWLYLFAPTPYLAAALIPSTFFASFGFGAAAAGIQEISPPAMRAQTSALYLFSVNIVGLGIGPTLVAALTDFVFRDEAAIGRSILVVSMFGLTTSLLFFRAGLAAFREAAHAGATWTPPKDAVA
ncbi:MAG: spinster family MFS transporter [Gemmatimonadales bacterium]